MPSLLAADAVGELAAAQHLVPGDGAALIGDDRAEVTRQAGDLVFLRAGVNDEDDLVNSLLCQNSSSFWMSSLNHVG